MSDAGESRPRKNSELAFDVNQPRPRVGSTVKTYRCDGCNDVVDERQIEDHMKKCLAGDSYNNFHEISTDEFLEESKDPFSLPLTYIDESKKDEETPKEGEGENPDGNYEEAGKEEGAAAPSE